MENISETKQLINEAKDIYLITSQTPEAIASTLALFYTLKDLGKNVNLIIDSFPENMSFLSPSLDFISYPKNFVISIPDKIAQISKIYYEKKDENLKIHLTLENGIIKKDNISLYFSEPKPDLIITIGVSDYSKELSSKLDSFGFLLDSPILNIDNKQENKKFGKINIVEDKSLTEIIMQIFENLKGKASLCLLAGIVIYTNNFKDKITAEVFEISSKLMKNGADIKTILENIK